MEKLFNTLKRIGYRIIFLATAIFIIKALFALSKIPVNYHVEKYDPETDCLMFISSYGVMEFCDA